MAPPGLFPIQKAMEQAGVEPGPLPVAFSPDEFMKRLGALPLAHQPGEQWVYHTASDVLGVLIARASGQSLEAFLRARIFAPLGMNDTGFHVPAEKLERLASAYSGNQATRALEVFDDRKLSRYARPPAFEAGGRRRGSAAGDFPAFFPTLAAEGPARRARPP